MSQVDLDLFDAVRAAPTLAQRRKLGRRAATRLAELLRSAPAVDVRILPLGTEPLDTRAAFGATLRTAPRWWTAARRALEITLPSGAQILLDPAAPNAWARTPIGARIAEARPRRARTLMADTRALTSSAGVSLLVYTTLRGQALAPVLGTARGDGVEAAIEPLFPNARALVAGAGWSEALDPAPGEAAMLVREDRALVRAPELITRDVLIDDALALVCLPGRSPGQLSAFMRVQREGRSRVLVWSHNSAALDGWDPHASSLPGFEAAARQEGREVVTGEDSICRVDQELAMAIERVAADWDETHPAMHFIGTPLALRAGLLRTPVHAL